MPYNSGIKHLPARFASHKAGRYVVDTTGMLQGKEGALIDLHRFFTQDIPFLEIMPIQTKTMRASGLYPGGFALVHKAGKPVHESIVVVSYNGQVIIRRLIKRDNRWWLIADDPREPPLAISDDVEIHKIGTVVGAYVNLSKSRTF